MSDYQHVKIKQVEDTVIRLHVTEVHPDMTELARIVDRKGQIRKSMRKRLRNFAALLLLESNYQDNSFAELLGFMDAVGTDPSLAVQRVITDVEIEDLEPLEMGSAGPMHSATVTITVASPLLLRSFRKGKSHGAVATLDGDINL